MRKTGDTAGTDKSLTEDLPVILSEDPSASATATCCEPHGGLSRSSDKPIGLFSNPRAYLFGTLAAFGIVGIYLGMNTLTADWYFAKDQFSEYRWWIIALAIGLAVQVTLFAMFRSQIRGMRMRAAKSSIAASGGISVVAMMACCSHYLATLIPVIGVSFLSASAVAGLAQYQPYFFLTGVISSLFGIGLMLRMMVKHRMIRAGVVKKYLNFGLRYTTR